MGSMLSAELVDATMRARMESVNRWRPVAEEKERDDGGAAGNRRAIS